MALSNALRPLGLASLLIGAACFAACSSSSDAGEPVVHGEPADDSGTEEPEPDTGASNPDPDASVGEAGLDGGGFTYKPVPSGCITDVAAGDHSFTCETLNVDVTIPDMFAKCPPRGCGLILELHGDTGTGLLIDANQTLRKRGSERGYIVLAPTGPAIGTIGNTTYPGSTWGTSQDANLVAMVQTFVSTFKVDPKRVHVEGFSRGGYTTWRMACNQSNLFASVAVGGAGNGAQQLTANQPEPTCFEGSNVPARPLDVLILMGHTDSKYGNIVNVRNAALSTYGLTAADQTVVMSGGATWTHVRAKKAGWPIIEWFDHTYETDPTGTQAAAKGHCIPGSTLPANAPQYAMACKPPTAFDWGAEVLTFFDAHPKP